MMERPKLGSINATYEKLASGDDADPETVIPPAVLLGRQQKPRTLLSRLWLFLQIGFIAISIPIWAASVWMTYITARELGQARPLLSDLLSSSLASNSSVTSSSSHNSTVSPSNVDSSSSGISFIPGATLPSVPGYGLVYNTSYCNGWSDPEGAKARGCVLDPSQGGWVHELCHDSELLDEWLNIRDFGWFLDPEGRRPISQARVWAADIPGGVMTPLYTTGWDFHIEHCRFVVRLRIKNGMRRDRGLGYLALDVGHLDHCVKMMMEMNTPEKKGKDLNRVVLGAFGGGTEGFGLAGECYMPAVCQYGAP